MGTTDEENKTENKGFDWSSLGGEFKTKNKGFNWSRKPYKPVLSQDMEEKRKADQADMRDMVLAKIEELEDIDPHYKRPYWISPDEKSLRKTRGVYLTERESGYLGSGESFEKEIERFFPHPRDH
jgi:hypothetical protein